MTDHEKETIVENDVVKIEMDRKGTAYIKPKKDDVKLSGRDLAFLNKVSRLVEE